VCTSDKEEEKFDDNTGHYIDDTSSRNADFNELGDDVRDVFGASLNNNYLFCLYIK